MYAIAFDLDTGRLQAAYGGPSWQNAYDAIKGTLEGFGFSRQQGSVYFGGPDPVTAVLAVQALARQYPWFSASVRDIRLLRIEDSNDLMPAIEEVAADGTPHAVAPVAGVPTQS